MKKTQTLIVLLSLLFSSFCVHAQSMPIPAPPQLAASSWVLLDANSGRILVKHKENTRIEPASITKIMTAYVVYQALSEGVVSKDDEVLISEKAWKMPGSRMFVEVGTKVRLGDLLKGMVIQSGNDAAVALSEHVAGSESAFVEQMNTTAQQLGMSNTSFHNVSGLPHDKHYTSAMDIAILSKALIKYHPEHYKYYSQKKFKYNNIEQANRNRLLFSDDSVDGIKTGHTEAAGYCLAASAKRQNTRLIAIVMGTSSKSARAKYTQTLLNYGFRYFETHKLYDATKSIRAFKVWKGSEDNVYLRPQHDVYVTVRRGQYGRLKPSLENVPSPLIAPLQLNQPLGEVVVRLDDKELVRQPLVVQQSVEKGGFFKRLWHSFLLLFE